MEAAMGVNVAFLIVTALSLAITGTIASASFHWIGQRIIARTRRIGRYAIL